MTAIFSSASTQEYKNKYHQEIYKDTLGAVFQLLQYELRATSIGPQRSRLTLYILKFKNLGAAGSGVFGQIPRSIEDDFANGAPALLTKVAVQRKQRDSTDSQGASTRQASPRSNNLQISVIDHEISANGQSQFDSTTFATQLPRAQSTTLPLSPSTRIYTNGLGASILKPKNLDQGASHPLQVQTLKSLSNAELLASLRNPPLERSVTLPDTSETSSGHPTSLVKNQHSDLMGLQMSIESLGGYKPTERMIENSGSASKHQALPFQDQPSVQAVNPEQLLMPSPSDLVQEQQNLVADSDIRETSKLAISNQHLSTCKVASSKRQKARKISTRDVRISKDQADLLSRSDCKLSS